MFKLKLITLLRLDFINRRIKERISSIVWRFLLFDALVYGLWTPAAYLLSYIASFFVPGLSLDLETVVRLSLFAPIILFCVLVLVHVLCGTPNVAYDKSIAKIMFTRCKLRLGWAKFCVIQKKKLKEKEWSVYKTVEMRKHKKVYYDDPKKAALAIWVGGFQNTADDLNQVFTLLIKGREYDLPKLRTVTVEAIKEHIEQCLEMDKSFYG